MADKDLQHVQHIRGSEAASDAYTGLEGEVTINHTSQSVRVHDGVTEGGHGTVYHARVAEIPNENDIPKDWAVGCRVIAGPGTVAGAGVVPLPDLGAERIIGAFNGKKVYEKTFAVTTGSLDADTPVADCSSLNIDKVLDIRGSCTWSNQDAVALDHGNGKTNNSLKVYYSVSRNSIVIRTFDSGPSQQPGFVTIRYTKTTD